MFSPFVRPMSPVSSLEYGFETGKGHTTTARHEVRDHFWEKRSWNDKEEDTGKRENWGKVHGGRGTGRRWSWSWTQGK